MTDQTALAANLRAAMPCPVCGRDGETAVQAVARASGVGWRTIYRLLAGERISERSAVALQRWVAPHLMTESENRLMDGNRMKTPDLSGIKPFTPEEEAAERAYIAEYVSDPPWAQTTHTSLYSLRRWIATLDAARAERARLRERVVSRLAGASGRDRWSKGPSWISVCDDRARGGSGSWR